MSMGGMDSTTGGNSNRTYSGVGWANCGLRSAATPRMLHRRSNRILSATSHMIRARNDPRRGIGIPQGQRAGAVLPASSQVPARTQNLMPGAAAARRKAVRFVVPCRRLSRYTRSVPRDQPAARGNPQRLFSKRRVRLYWKIMNPLSDEAVFDAFRRWGYLAADLDPLGYMEPLAP